jgi:hypothetical protein
MAFAAGAMGITASAQSIQLESLEPKTARLEAACAPVKLRLGDGVNSIKGFFTDMGTGFWQGAAPVPDTPSGGVIQRLAAVAPQEARPAGAGASTALGAGLLAVFMPFISIPLFIIAKFGVIKGFFASLFGAVQAVVSNAAARLSGVWTEAVTLFTTVWGYGYDLFSGIWDGIKGVVGAPLVKAEPAALQTRSLEMPAIGGRPYASNRLLQSALPQTVSGASAPSPAVSTAEGVSGSGAGQAARLGAALPVQRGRPDFYSRGNQRA